jgi:hypothetical protein
MNRFTVNANLQTFADELNEKICGDQYLAAVHSKNEAHKRQRRTVGRWHGNQRCSFDIQL